MNVNSRFSRAGHPLVRLAKTLLSMRALLGAMTLAILIPNLSAASETIPKVPTTKIIAIGNLTAKATPAAMSAVMPQEVRDTVELHLAGVIEQWNVRTDKSGVVFVLNMVDLAKAREALDKLPLAKAGLMEFELIPVGPLSPLALLLPEQAK